jgi:hypothetical protein
MYHYLVGIGYNKTKREVDAIFEISQQRVNLASLKMADDSLSAEYQGFYLRVRYAMLDVVHLKTEFKMDRKTITTYINSLSDNELEKLIKDSK